MMRPHPEATDEAWHEYVHIRTNPRGRYVEHWQHVAGCRRWLAVERDTLTHEVFSVTDGASVAREGGR